MTAAGSNEAEFKEIIESKFGEILNGKRIWRDNESQVEISVDQTIETDDYNLLIEIDSGNYAKLIVGQYTLLNELHDCPDKKPVFIVVHFYNRYTDTPYNPERTIRNLNFINQKVLSENGIPFLVFNLNTFNDFLTQINSLKELNEKIKENIAQQSTVVKNK
ncbi:hypothetical protein BWZ22_13120 [Seonamhaeicola sp. S2-3]|uniref:hypothetical protein n=1 Tax=Seonamhaeicola sp. S2-3 TaxID=1936081 RepID=UPI000972CE19|nr:hypothetical protein [Seonamhaeicola sp. S2-3]APY12112.1 hypothetical protein BWZ22_13120 [Seonamhaeicola sp. S2-3]